MGWVDRPSDYEMTTTAVSTTSTGRVLWIIWCLGWAAFWMFSLFALNIFAVVLVPLSLLAILLPVGKPRRVKHTIIERSGSDQIER